MAGGNNAAVRHHYGTAIRTVLGGCVVSHCQDHSSQKNSALHTCTSFITAKRSIIADHLNSGLLLLPAESAADDCFDDQMVGGAGDAPANPEIDFPIG